MKSLIEFIRELFNRKNNRAWMNCLSSQVCIAFLYKYDRKLINIILKNVGNNISEVPIFMKEHYQGAYENKVKFAQKYAEGYLFSDDLAPYINYRFLAKKLFKNGPYYGIKTNGRIHVFLKD